LGFFVHDVCTKIKLIMGWQHFPQLAHGRHGIWTKIYLNPKPLCMLPSHPSMNSFWADPATEVGLESIQREVIPWEIRGQGSYLVPDLILPNALSAGFLGDTAAFQHDLVWGTEAAFWGMVPTGTCVAITVPGAAVLTVVVNQGWWTRHSCRQRKRSLSTACTSQRETE
jgi:hypothetical protein